MLIQYRDNYDPDAAIYLDAVETADGQTLEAEVKRAISRFVKGCKNDGIWTAIKASCILSGARTLDGALVPLVGTAPTNYNFVGGDYNRKTGLVGDGSSKYLDSNRANNADPKDSNHNALYIHTAATNSPAILMGNGSVTVEGNNRIVWSSSSPYLHFDSRSLSDGYVSVDNASPTGFIGHARTNNVSADFRLNSTTTNYAMTSTDPISTNVFVFSRELGGVPSNGRLSFYSIGEYLELTKLDARVTALVSAFNRYISS